VASPALRRGSGSRSFLLSSPGLGRSSWPLCRGAGTSRVGSCIELTVSRFDGAEFMTADAASDTGFTGIVPIAAGALFLVVGALLAFNADPTIATINRPFPYPRRIELVAKAIVVVGAVLLAVCGLTAMQIFIGVALACGALVFVAFAAIFVVAFPPEDLR
jgi:hypothetical protein